MEAFFICILLKKDKIMAWIYLFIAGLFEVAWAIGMKYNEGWTQLIPSLITALLMICSFFFLSLALKELPLSTSYAIWTGIGVIGTAIYGFVFLKEATDTLRILCILLIIVGIIGLKLLSASK